MDNIQTLKDWIAHCQNIVFFGGAGVSCESGIPDFRSVNGLYNQHYDYPPETILSHTFFQKNPQVFYRFYREKMLALNALPNPAHLALVRLEEQGKLKAVVTQNIDGCTKKRSAGMCWNCTGAFGCNPLCTMPPVLTQP